MAWPEKTTAIVVAPARSKRLISCLHFKTPCQPVKLTQVRIRSSAWNKLEHLFRRGRIRRDRERQRNIFATPIAATCLIANAVHRRSPCSKLTGSSTYAAWRATSARSPLQSPFLGKNTEPFAGHFPE